MKTLSIKNVLLFIVPHLLYVMLFFYLYNSSFSLLGDSFEIFYREIFIMSGIYFVIFSLLHYILRIRISNLRVFFIEIVLVFLSFVFVHSSVIAIILLVLLLVVMMIVKEGIREKVSYLFSYMIILLFLYNFVLGSINTVRVIVKYDDVNYEKETVVDQEKNGANIYWIHADAMVNFDTVRKFFYYDSKYLKDYLVDNDFYVNDSASLNSLGHTAQALVSLYNPYYYDEYFSEYIDNMNKNDYSSLIVSYRDLQDKRINNELFIALKKKDYKIAAITEFNQYSSFYADYMFNYYSYQKSNKKELSYFTALDNTLEDVDNFISYTHIKTLMDTTFLHFFLDNYSNLKYENLNYDDIDCGKYKVSCKSDYWKQRAIMKSIDTINNEEKKFTFIDFSINHTPWRLDRNGKIVNSAKDGFLTKNFLDNYIHSNYLLVELIEFIKESDSNAVIVIQADHGFHTVSNTDIYDFTNKSLDKDYFVEDSDELINSTINAVYVPEEFRNGEEKYLSEPLNISRYLVNNFVGNNYRYIE